MHNSTLPGLLSASLCAGIIVYQIWGTIIHLCASNYCCNAVCMCQIARWHITSKTRIHSLKDQFYSIWVSLNSSMASQILSRLLWEFRDYWVILLPTGGFRHWQKNKTKKKVCYPFPAESYLPTSFTYSEPSEVEAQSYVESRSYWFGAHQLKNGNQL